MIILRQKEYSNIHDEMAKAFSESSQIIANLQPKGWKKVVMYAEVTKHSFDIHYYTKINNKFVKCFELEGKNGLTRSIHIKAFEEIYDLLLPIQKKLKCFAFTLTLENNNNGKANMTFDIEYDNPWDEKDDDKAVSKWWKFKEDWKKKYLK